MGEEKFRISGTKEKEGSTTDKVRAGAAGAVLHYNPE
jgi:hypothetical protein